VAPEHRRQGIASSLIAACERLGQLWGRSSLWLHVDQRNRGALELYRSLDYRVCASKGLRNKRYLMAKALPALQMQQRTQTDPAIAASDNAAPAAGALVPCDSTAGNGSQPAKVYLWDADHV
jgi:ribosomal protein S18 acetylase RimI-like enzyme